jgi:glyoxylase-like metal-dependent hydrolase (beta-lactamase superfamily II)
MPLRLTQVAPGVHRLDNVYTNWYLLEAGGRLTVLDAGLPGDWREFSSALSRLGYTPAEIDAVLITHHHPDHAGNAERLRSSWARGRVEAGERRRGAAPPGRVERCRIGHWDLLPSRGL